MTDRRALGSQRLQEKVAANKLRLRRREVAVQMSDVASAAASVCDRFSIECETAAHAQLWRWCDNQYARPPDISLDSIDRPLEAGLRAFLRQHALDGPCFIIGYQIAVGADAADAPALVDALWDPLGFWGEPVFVMSEQRWCLLYLYGVKWRFWRADGAAVDPRA